jgi:hypothetical protein
MGLGNEDLLLHLCAHTAYLHCFEFWLRSLHDLSLLVTQCGRALDWDRIAAQAREWRWTRATSLALVLAADLWRTQAPARLEASERPIAKDVLDAAREQVLAGFTPALSMASGLEHTRARRIHSPCRRRRPPKRAANDSSVDCQRPGRCRRSGTPAADSKLPLRKPERLNAPTERPVFRFESIDPVQLLHSRVIRRIGGVAAAHVLIGVRTEHVKSASLGHFAKLERGERGFSLVADQITETAQVVHVTEPAQEF